MIKRKKRCDRNHIIYQIKVGAQVYIGMTHVQRGRPNASLQRRWKKHVQRALTENRDWKLCKAIRRHGPERFEVVILQIVRGKENAHKVERSLIRKLNPSLNSDKR